MSRDIGKALQAAGGTHTLNDVLDAINKGLMQSFTRGDTWLVTQVLDFPQYRVLELFLLVGEMQDVPYMERMAVEYGKSIGAKKIRAFGRPGWSKFFRDFDGWEQSSTVYSRDL